MNLKYIMILPAIAALTVRQAKAQTKPGFVQQENIKVSGILADSQIYTLSLMQKQTARSYYDGLGRVIQTIGVQASPAQNDLIQPVAYDKLGRQTVGYLPYGGKSTDTMGSYRSNAISTAQPLFYNTTTQYLVAVDTAAHNRQVFESSPLQRLLSAGMVGTGYQPGDGGTQYYKTISYRPNAATDSVLVWNMYATPMSGTYYTAYTLSVTDGKDEDNTETLSFTDLEGHLILKRQKLGSANLDTYYIYNNAGMIAYIVPPKALGLMKAASSYSFTVTGVSALIFHFVYDTMGRLTQKTVPAKGVVYIVYDPLNRPVLVQDSNMRVSNNWMYIKYDAKGRAISQGTYIDATHNSLSSMQTYVSGISYATWCEVRSTSASATGYYTNNVFPTGGTPLAYTYYDDYDLKQNGTPYTYGSQGLTGEIGATTAQVKGAPTMTWQTTVGSGLSSTWLLKATFYDKRGNPVQTQSNNHVYYVNATTLTDTATTVPDFMGVPQISKVKKQTASGVKVTVQTTFTYDQMYRVQTVGQSYNGGASSTVASYTYNELGQVIKKSLGYVSGSTYLQNVDMRYNIRGQLLSINNSKLTSDTGKTNNDTNDVFGMLMLYDQYDTNLGNTAYHNGKLSAVKWMSKNASGVSTYERAFKYNYDGINRYTGETYAERTTTGTGSFSNNVDGFDENAITYDANGNILTLKRNSSQQGTNSHHEIDNLTYTYNSANPDQLLNVADIADSLHADAGFRNLTGSTANYSYDGNGNLTNEPYKGINVISYDVLNRTDKMTFTSSANRYIDYTYDLSGNLIRKRQYDNVGGVATLQNTTDYLDGFVFTTVAGAQTLSYFAMPEGRVLYSSGTFTREFIITDQQGNARVSFQNNGSNVAVVKQENSYYGFGLVMPDSPVATPTTPNKHLYNGGSEWQNDYANLPDYYQTFNRNYDAALGRWIGVDPQAESAESMTSYQYAGNNPIMYNDPLGDLIPYPGSHVMPQGNYTYQLTGGHVSLWGEVWNANGSADMIAQAAAADMDSGGGGSSSGTDLNAGYSPSSATPDLATNINYNGLVTHYDDGSNANFKYLGNGIFLFTGYTDQGGRNIINFQTLENFVLFPIQPIQLAGVTITASAIKKSAANQGGDPPGGLKTYLSNLWTTVKMTGDWWFGFSDDGLSSKVTTYNNDKVANAMRSSPGVDIARNLYYNSHKTFYHYDFGLQGLYDAGSNPIQQFVGSYDVFTQAVNGNLQFTIKNVTSVSSFDYHLSSPLSNPTSGPLGNVTQYFIFTEPLRK